MPAPAESRVPALQLNAQERARADEVEEFLARRYREAGYEIVATTQTYNGDIVDWVDPDTIPGSQKAPPTSSALPSGSATPDAEDLGPPMELEAYPELRGPSGTVPFYRPSYLAYVKQPEGRPGNHRFRSIGEFISGQQSGQPSGQDRLYGGFGYSGAAAITGSVAHFSVWEEDNIESNTFSLLEIAVMCEDSAAGEQDLVGAAVSRDRSNFGDVANAPARLQVELYHRGGTMPFARWA